MILNVSWENWVFRIQRWTMWSSRKALVGPTLTLPDITTSTSRGNGIWIQILNVSKENSAFISQRWVGGEQLLTDITTSTSFPRISGLLKSTGSSSCKPTSDCYPESFVQGESQALSSLRMLYRDIEIWKKDCLVIMPMNLAVLCQGLRGGSLQRFRCWADIACSS